MDKLANCLKCGRVFKSDGYLSICPECMGRDYGEFDEIRDYIRTHPNAKLLDLSKDLDVPVATIKRYLKEERLEIVDDKNTFLQCEKCNTPIKSGMYCDECAKIVQKEKGAMRPPSNDEDIFKKNEKSGPTTIKFSQKK
jgi:Zn finger protein HypA/HybF involved in hydrogenase expression